MPVEAPAAPIVTAVLGLDRFETETVPVEVAVADDEELTADVEPEAALLFVLLTLPLLLLVPWSRVVIVVLVFEEIRLLPDEVPFVLSAALSEARLALLGLLPTPPLETEVEVEVYVVLLVALALALTLVLLGVLAVALGAELEP